MVYNGKPYSNGWFGGTTIFGNIHIVSRLLKRGFFWIATLSGGMQENPTSLRTSKRTKSYWALCQNGISTYHQKLYTANNLAEISGNIEGENPFQKWYICLQQVFPHFSTEPNNQFASFIHSGCQHLRSRYTSIMETGMFRISASSLEHTNSSWGRSPGCSCFKTLTFERISWEYEFVEKETAFCCNNPHILVGWKKLNLDSWVNSANLLQLKFQNKARLFRKSCLGS